MSVALTERQNSISSLREVENRQRDTDGMFQTDRRGKVSPRKIPKMLKVRNQEERPKYRDYLRERRLRSKKRHQTKGILRKNDTPESEGSKDEGIHSNGEKDQETEVLKGQEEGINENNEVEGAVDEGLESIPDDADDNEGTQEENNHINESLSDSGISAKFHRTSGEEVGEQTGEEGGEEGTGGVPEEGEATVGPEEDEPARDPPEPTVTADDKELYKETEESDNDVMVTVTPEEDNNNDGITRVVLPLKNLNTKKDYHSTQSTYRTPRDCSQGLTPRSTVDMVDVAFRRQPISYRTPRDYNMVIAPVYASRTDDPDTIGVDQDNEWGERPVAPHKRGYDREGNRLVSSSPKRSFTSTSNVIKEVWIPGEDTLYVYTYSSSPRIIQVHRSGNGRLVTFDSFRSNGNPMYDRRVVRGSNFGRRSDDEYDGPKWNPYFAYARSLSRNDWLLPGSDEKERILVAHLAKRTLKQALKEVAHEEDGEKERINRLIEETAASFIKPEEEIAVSDSAEGKREDPEGRETSPPQEETPAEPVLEPEPPPSADDEK